VPQRQPSGQRAYPKTAVGRIRAIKAAQRLGFTLNKIQELLALSDRGRMPAEVHRRAHAKLLAVERASDSLMRILPARRRDPTTSISCGAH
jgi:DNA-binding transcriptional MerR regulator